MDALGLSPEDYASIAPSAEEQSALADLNRPGLLARTGQQLANAPTDLFNDLTKLWYNAGIALPGAEPVEVPGFYDIPEAKTWQETGVDIVTGIAKTLPLLLTGEAAVAGAAKTLGAAPRIASVLGSAAGFGLSGAVESPEMGAEQAALGAAFRAGDFLPLKYRSIASLALGGGTAAMSYAHDENVTKAGVIGGINAALPLILRGKTKAALEKNRAEVPQGGAAMPRAEMPPEGSLIETPGTIPHENPDFFRLQGERAGIPPPGSLVRDATFTAEEALAGRKPVATSQFRLSNEPELEFPAIPEVNGVPPVLPKINANVQKLLFAPEGSLVRHPNFTAGEVARGMEGRALEAKRSLLQPPAAPKVDPLEAKFAAIKAKLEADKAAAEVVTTNPRINPSRKITNTTILHSEDSEMILKAAKKLKLIFNGAKNESLVTGQPKTLAFTDTTKAGDTLYFTEGATVADLKREFSRKARENAAKETEQKIVEEITTKPPPPVEKPVEVPPSAKPANAPVAAPPAPRPVATSQAVTFRGQTFTGATHEAAIAKLAKRFPNYREANRKAEPIVRGYMTPEGKFEVTNLLDIARKAEAKAAPLAEETVLEIEIPEEPIVFTTEPVAAPPVKPPVATVATPPAKVEPIVSLQKPLETEVKGNTVKIGDSSYEIKKVGAVWTHEGMPLSKTKQGAVRAIKDLHKASTSSDPALEAAQTKLAAAAEGQRQVGEKVYVDFDGSPELGTIVTASKEGITQVRIAGGDIIDVLDRRIADVPKSGKFEITIDSETKAIGDLNAFRRLEEENAAKTAGLKLKRPTGEAGYIPADVAWHIGRYYGGPVLGAIAGAAMSDEDHRLSGAFEGAMLVGAVTIGGPMIFRLLAEGHPDVTKPGSYPAAVKATVKSVGEAVKAPQKSVIKASQTFRASNTDKLLLWMTKYLSTDPALSRAIGKAHGPLETLAKTFHQVLPLLANSVKDPKDIKVIGDYLRGQINYTQFEKLLGNLELAKATETARVSEDIITETIAKSLKPGPLQDTLRANKGKYLTTAFRIFTEKKYFPTEEQVMKIAMEAKDQRVPLELRIKIAEQELRDLKVRHGLYGSRSGASVSGILFRKEQLSPAYQDALGIYTDPIQQLIATTNKLLSSGRSAALINEIADGVGADGLRYVYSKEAMGIMKNTLYRLKEQAVNAKDLGKVATLQKKIDSLDDYIFDLPNEAHGRLSNNFISRRMHNSLSHMDLVMKESNSWVARHLRKATTLFKYNKTVLSIPQFMRQVLNVPLLGFMSRTGPRDWYEGLHTLVFNAAERERLTNIGIVGGDFVGGQLSHDLDALLQGNMAKFSFTNTPLRLLHKWQQLWRTPDLVVRVAAFQKKEAELLAKIPADLDAASMAKARLEAENAAIDFTNRYTMNYEVIPPGVRIFSNLPFANQFLTWVFEMTRVTKNLAEDAIGKGPSGKPDLYAAGILAAFAAAPFALQKASESMLSSKDKKDWEKAKGLLPEYARSNFVWVTHRDKQGHFHYINFTGLIIHDNYLKMFRDIIHGDKAAFKADNPIFGWENTPLLNIATNQMTGKDIHTKQTLRTMSDRVNSIRRDFAPPLLGTDFDRFVKALTPNAQGGFGITDARSGQQTDLAGLLLSYTTSLRGYSTDLSALQKRAMYLAKLDISDQRYELNRVLRSNASADYKKRATERFEFINKQIMLELARQVRPDTAD